MLDATVTQRSAPSSLVASSSSSATADSDASFVKNTPSTVLFFLAMSVGVIIALVFVFFTVRYFIRSRFGLHMCPVSYHGMMFGGNYGDPQLMNHSPSNRELSEYLDYLRVNHLFNDEFFEQHLIAALDGSRRRRRRRRRGRYSRMKKLKPEEVDRLFPKQLYVDWIRTGDDTTSLQVDVIDDDVQNEKDVVVNAIQQPTPSNQTDFDVVELQDLKSSQAFTTHTDAASLALQLHSKTELHFDSGNCAICLETFEDDDIVRGLICGHVFHAECVDPWLTLRRACCPICKRDYYKENNERNQINSANGITEHPHNNNSAPNPHSSPEEIDLGTAEQAEDQQTDGNQTSTANQDSRPRGDHDTADSIDLDLIRDDPNLRALLNELIPLSERANTVLRGEENDELENKARALARSKFLNVFKRAFWKTMGVKEQDIFYWAVITLHYSQPDGSRPHESSQPQREPAESHTEAGLQTTERRVTLPALEAHRAATEMSQPPSLPAASNAPETRRDSLQSTATNYEDTHEEPDSVSRRSIVEQRV